MFHEKYLSKLIIFTPIVLIILVTTLVTFTQISKLENKFIDDSSKLKAKLINEEKNKLSQKIDTLNDYILYKKSTTKKLINEQIQKRVELVYNLVLNKYNKDTGILRQNEIKKDLINIIKQMNLNINGYFFLVEVKQKEFLPILYPSNRNYENKNILKTEDTLHSKFIKKVKDLLKTNNEGYVSYTLKQNINILNSYKKISYLKKFEPYNWVIGYGEYFEIIDNLLKEEVLNRINSLKFSSEQKIFVLDENNAILNKNPDNLTQIEDKDFIKKVKLYRKNNYDKTYFYWKKNYENLIAFKYIKDWNWVLVNSIDLKSLEKTIIDIIGNKKIEEKNFITYSIKIAFIVILIGSLLTFFLSKRIEMIFKSYKNNIESQRNALRNINVTLESKVKEKTKELEQLNEQLKDEVKKEVFKNREKDQMLFNQSKMAAMGEMIGNIAHQWRQPLSTISTAASGIAIKIDYNLVSPEEIKDDLKSIVNTTQYLSQTIEDFRNFFKENKQKEKFLLKESIVDSLNIVDSSFKNNYIEVVLNTEDIEVNTIRSELTQAILNILTNAKDVLTDKINQFEEKRVIQIDLYKDEEFAYIEIWDNGGGIKKEIINKIFEPYFTTKHQSQGTGIGLYMTREIIIKHLNGNIKVENINKKYQDKNYLGANFKIIIPVNSLA
ncbi:hypothetical protein CRV00_03800 [Malaciobacter molluscorum]|uniref:sensor histidine kinase n=1 Tax=Malaciobacter molluscorum TaxID=1032072 RepID=UPI00100B0250|nr:cache domain-containing protein [Malaciobacter molluscorum]RXJ95577.1 hypothetical protein CRV00_03800 [Malaciobacter molluscorum]